MNPAKPIVVVLLVAAVVAFVLQQQKIRSLEADLEKAREEELAAKDVRDDGEKPAAESDVLRSASPKPAKDAPDTRKQIAELEQALKTAKLDARLELLANHPEIRLEAVGKNLDVRPAIRAALEITDEEVNALEAAFAQAKTEMTELEKKAIVVKENSDERLVAEFPVLPEGKAVKRRLRTAVQGALGEERSEIFLNASDDAFIRSFSDFGGKSLEVEITWNDDGSFGLKETRFTPDRGGQSTTSRSSINDLPPRYRGLIELSEPE